MYKRGDIVLIPFPFTDLTGAKIRPAVVVSTMAYEKENGNITVAMITSVPHSTASDYEVKNWQLANLLAPSWVRMKLATIDPKLVRYKPGNLTDADLSEVDKRLRMALGL